MNPAVETNPGMNASDLSTSTLRDWFAGQALCAFLSDTRTNPATREQRASMAIWCYAMADAMLCVRLANPSYDPGCPQSNQPIASLGLSSRARTALMGYLGCTTVGHVANVTIEQLRAIRGCGPGTIREIVQSLKSVGMSLAGEQR